MNGLVLVLLLALLRKGMVNRRAEIAIWLSPRHKGLSHWFYQGRHRGTRSRTTVAEVIAKARAQHLLPSAYYHVLAPSRRGMAHGTV